jgi:hypothetical protein
MKAVLTFGIYTVDQYARASGKRHLSGAAVSYGLLQIGDNPTEQEISRFENISLIFCTSNGTRRTTCRQRMQDVDAATLELLQRWHQPGTDLLMQDRGASSCLTSAELAGRLFSAFPYASLEASDRLLWVFRISLAKGKGYIIEPDGKPLQYICPPFVVSLNAYKAERNPLRRLIAARGKRLFGQLGFPKICQTYKINQISCIHPEAASLCKKDSRFQIRLRSVFEQSSGLDVLRTMNVLNKDYFPIEKLVEGCMLLSRVLNAGDCGSLGELWRTRQITLHFLREWKSNSKLRRGLARDQR